jgi:outer membrane biosynthesis protein TonB
MRAATAFFAGVGTVAVAIGAGLGGGLLLGDIMSPQQPKYPSSEVTRLEQRASQPPIQAANGAPQPVPYMAATQIANTVAEQPAPPQQPQPPQQQAQPPQLQQASAPPAEPPKQPERSTPPQPVNAAAQPSPADRPSARAASEDSFAKSREADMKNNEARRAEDRRKAERRQQWADKRKWRQRQDNELGDVEASVREATEARSFGRGEMRPDRSEPRQLFGREPAFGTGRMTLFDD